jgi:hypothetical protein
MGWSTVWRVLALSLLPILAVTEAPVTHQHGGAAPGFYDAECPLAHLLASRSEASPNQRVDLARPFPASELAALPVLSGHLTASALSFEPRGPPLTV